MSLKTADAREAAANLAAWDTVIDARSPGEFAEDHLPGAVNWPVLDDEQRRIVGTLYVQDSPLAARKVGAAMVARNIAQLVERWVQDKPRGWQPLVYCWRGGQRSGALAWYLDQIGFRTTRLAGGYKGFRNEVRARLDGLPQRFQWVVLAGRTGSGKTRLLGALAAAGAQVLDLEGLARHRGSVLGGLPGEPQPSQKHFDTLLWQALAALDTARPVVLESESRKIGAVQLPDALVRQMREHGRVLRLELPDEARVQLLLEDYRHFLADPEPFCRLLDGLVPLRGRATVAAWQALARAGRWAEAFAALMREHYDPLYLKSIHHHFPGYDQAPAVVLAHGGPAALQAAAMALLAGPLRPPTP